MRAVLHGIPVDLVRAPTRVTGIERARRDRPGAQQRTIQRAAAVDDDERVGRATDAGAAVRQAAARAVSSGRRARQFNVCLEPHPAWSGAALAAALGESYPTVKRHVDLLTGALVVRQLQPWLPNLEKRLVKSPKVFVRDSGLLHALLGIRTFRDLKGHPSLGAPWEGLVLEAILARVSERDVAFWSTLAGAELDFIWKRGCRLIGFEAKWRDATVMRTKVAM
ncbi:MAG: DUF4143 domain-containing protein [Acidobacteria bacterium]|nr:DUF4143 domain-containing protein [Acidobacteriota bacterium]